MFVVPPSGELTNPFLQLYCSENVNGRYDHDYQSGKG